VSEDPLVDAFEAGKRAARDGKTIEDNPYKESGHERETTYADELHYQWFTGFLAGCDDSCTET
jgi:hypothetical protein